jgi:lipoyl(octanoyl) transferase
VPYEEGLALQDALVKERRAGSVPDLLLLLEHPHVITLGTSSHPGHVLADAAERARLGIELFETGRGGDVTYHGPGQLVGYPILDLKPDRKDLHRYLRDLEEVVIRVLAELEVEGRRVEGLTGVWIGERKVASIGVAVRRWVTWHGLALNVSTDLDAFRSFRPCGLDPEVMTRLADHVELPPASLLIEVLLVKHVCEVFDLDLPEPGAPPASGDARFPGLPILPG